MKATLQLCSVILSLIFVGGCSKATPVELAELTIRSEFRDAPANSVACISVDGHDAGKQLLDALRGAGLPVVPASACVYVAAPSKGSYERDSGRKAMLVTVISRLDRNEVEYVSRHHAKWAMRVILKVDRENGVWRVVDIVMREAA